MIQVSSFTQIRNGWTLLWTPTGAQFYRIVQSGLQIAQVTSNTYTWNGQGFTTLPPPLEVAEESNKTLSEQYQPFLVMQWYGEPACSRYQIQQYNGSSWVLLANIQETGEWIYTFQTGTLTDETTYNYRVVAVDSVGNTSVPRQYRKFILCLPVPPAINVSYLKPNIVVSISI